jgi:hypothetical protein
LACSAAFRDAYSTPKAALAAVACAAAALWAALDPKARRSRSPLDGPLLALAAACALSACLSIDPRLSLFGRYPETVFSLMGLCACCAAFLAGGALGVREGGIRTLGAWLAAGSLPVSAYALVQAAGFEPFMPGAEPMAGGRAFSTFGSPVFLGAYLALLSPLELDLALAGEGPARRALGAASLLLGLSALAATGSRGAWLGAAAGLLHHGLRAAGPRTRASLAAGLALSGVLAGAWALRRGAALVSSDKARLETWGIALRELSRRPWLGSGPDTFEIAFRRERSQALADALGASTGQSQAHDDLLQAAATLGGAGLLAYAWLQLAALRSARRTGRAGVDGAAAGLLALWVAAKFSALSLSSAWPAALVAGAAFSEPAAPGIRPRLRLAALWLCAAVFLPFAWISARADADCRAGLRARRAGAMREAAALLENAAALRPDVLAYRFDLCNLLFDAAGGASPEGRAFLLGRAAEAARDAAGRMPLRADAWRLLALCEGRIAGRSAAAEAALARFLALDARYPYLPRTR